MRILPNLLGQAIFMWHILCGVVLCAIHVEQWPDSIAYNRTLNWAKFFFMGRGFVIQDGHDISVDRAGNKRHDPLWLKISAPGRFACISKGPDWNNAQISFGETNDFCIHLGGPVGSRPWWASTTDTSPKFLREVASYLAGGKRPRRF